MNRNFITKSGKYLLMILALFVLSGCSENRSIANNLSERDANEIIVFLASKGIQSDKVKAESTQGGGGAAAVSLWNITVPSNSSVQAMALLNQQGLPRQQGVTLLKLFEKSGLMSSDKEENIRYQAGVEETLKNIIIKIDGVLDADVQISFPSAELLPGAPPQKAKAAVYVKHQGVFDDPNNHLETKIKRLLAGAIENLDFEDVSVISDKSKIASIDLKPETSAISGKAKGKEYVSIWSIIMTENSAGKFRSIFFLLIGLILCFGGIIGWLVYKYYPLIQHKSKEK
jgi:type III secretion protein J